jgi:hypothetical protein
MLPSVGQTRIRLPGPRRRRTITGAAAAILQVGLSTYLTHHEIMDAELTREQPLPSARATKVAPTTTPSSPA